MAAKKKPLLNVPSPLWVSLAEEVVREKKALPKAKLPHWKDLTSEGQASYLFQLESRGFEEGVKGTVRLPLSEQAKSLVSGGARPSLKVSQKRVVGAATGERDKALAAACQNGLCHAVVRTKTETLVGARENVLTPAELRTLEHALAQLGDTVRTVRKKRPAKSPFSKVFWTVLRDDIAPLLTDMAALAQNVSTHSENSTHPSVSDPPLSRVLLLERIAKLENPPIRLVWIPDLMRALRDRWSVNQIHQALRAAHLAGEIELRPESGVGRLTANDALLCPRDPDDHPLSHVLRLPSV